MILKPRIAFIIFSLLTVFTFSFAVSINSAFADAPYVTWSSVGTGYGNGIDTVSFRNNAIHTVGNYQFVAYYNGSGYATVARRDINSNSWTNYSTTYTADNVNDDHDVISFGIDGNGIMHMSWGMHNGSFHYATTSGSVLGSSFSPTFNTSTIAGIESSITYPEFYNLSDGDLMYVFRTGGSGGGNTLIRRYDSTAGTWSAASTQLTDGYSGGSVLYNGSWSADRNAYTNNLVFDSQGRIQMSWVWRETPDFQSNHDIMYAYATNENATTWYKMGGASQTMPIALNTAQVVKSIPVGSSLINQTSMTVDKNDNPIIATYWAPDGNTRQYMLQWYNGTSWQTSQISNRPYEAKITTNDAVKIRYVGRPIALVDADGRTLVITRSNDKSNHVTAYYSTDKTTWNSVDLTAADSGRYEPIYDEVRWKRDGMLSLFYEPAFANANGTRSAGSQPVSVLEWNSLRYLRDAITVDWIGGNGSGPTKWDVTGNWTNSAQSPDGKWTTLRFGNQSLANNVVDMFSAGRTVGNITFNAGTNTSIQSTGGYSLTLDNSGSNSSISVSGNHAILTPVILNNDLNVSGTGTINLSGGISGVFDMVVASGNVTAKSIQLDALNIGSGSVITIQAVAAGPLSGEINAVPEPSTLMLLAIGALFAIGYRRRRMSS